MIRESRLQLSLDGGYAQPERDGPVVRQANLHVRTELSGGHTVTEL
jgi:hypothetical protein